MFSIVVGRIIRNISAAASFFYGEPHTNSRRRCRLPGYPRAQGCTPATQMPSPVPTMNCGPPANNQLIKTAFLGSFGFSARANLHRLYALSNSQVLSGTLKRLLSTISRNISFSSLDRPVIHCLSFLSSEIKLLTIQYILYLSCGLS